LPFFIPFPTPTPNAIAPAIAPNPIKPESFQTSSESPLKVQSVMFVFSSAVGFWFIFSVVSFIMLETSSAI
jgi:hypothetical protein